MTKNQKNFILTIIVLCLAGFACKAYTEGKPAAESAVSTFHAQLNDGQFDSIYEASDQMLKDATSHEDILKLFNAVHNKLGNVTDSKAVNWQVGNYNLTTTVTMVYETTFEKGKAVENFVFVIDGKQAKLAGWHINSNELITN